MWTVFHSIKRCWTQHFVGQTSALLIMTMAYGATIFIALALTNVQNLFDMWGQTNQVSIFLQSKTEADKSDAIANYLKTQEIVQSFKLVSAQESAEQFKKKFSKVSSKSMDVSEIGRFFPQYYSVRLNEDLAYKSPASSLEAFSAELQKQFSSIKNVSYGKRWLQRYVSLLSATQWVAYFLIVTFFIASVVVSSSVIKTIIFSRRDEIEILEFIGADDFGIYMPQVLNGVLLTVVAFCLGLFANYGIFLNFHSMNFEIVSQQALQQVQFVSATTLAIMFVSAVFMVCAYATLTIFFLMPRRKKAILIQELSS